MPPTTAATSPIIDLPDGGRVAFVTLAGDSYRAVLLDGDDRWENWRVEKELDGGCYADGYTVTVPVSGNDGNAACTCPGFHFGGWCRHAAGLARELVGG